MTHDARPVLTDDLDILARLYHALGLMQRAAPRTWDSLAWAMAEMATGCEATHDAMCAALAERMAAVPELFPEPSGTEVGPTPLPAAGCGEPVRVTLEDPEADPEAVAELRRRKLAECEELLDLRSRELERVPAPFYAGREAQVLEMEVTFHHLSSLDEPGWWIEHRSSAAGELLSHAVCGCGALVTAGEAAASRRAVGDVKCAGCRPAGTTPEARHA